MTNSRAELAVKATKQLLVENVGPNGELENNRMVQLYLRREIHLILDANYLLHRSFWDEKGLLLHIRKSAMTYNNPQISNMWCDAWSKKEEALRSR